MAKFIGREREIQLLKQLQKRGLASLAVIKGRRRIGKSRLLEEFAQSFSAAYFFLVYLLARVLLHRHSETSLPSSINTSFLK